MLTNMYSPVSAVVLVELTKGALEIAGTKSVFTRTFITKNAAKAAQITSLAEL